MSNKNKTIALASLIAAGAGVAAVAASNSHKQAKAKKIAEKQAGREVEHHTAIQSVENTRKTAKVFIIPTVTTRHLHIRKTGKVSMRKRIHRRKWSCIFSSSMFSGS